MFWSNITLVWTDVKNKTLIDWYPLPALTCMRTAYVGARRTHSYIMELIIYTNFRKWSQIIFVVLFFLRKKCLNKFILCSLMSISCIGYWFLLLLLACFFKCRVLFVFLSCLSVFSVWVPKLGVANIVIVSLWMFSGITDGPCWWFSTWLTCVLLGWVANWVLLEFLKLVLTLRLDRYRGGSVGRASDSRSKDPSFEPRQEHKKNLCVFLSQNVVLTCHRCTQPPCVHARIRMITYARSRSCSPEFGGLWKHKKTQHALNN